MIDVSVVIPVYNERQNVPLCYRELRGVLEGCADVFEIIFIDDGSSDGSVEQLRDIAKGDSRVRVIEFRRNFGQTAAMAAGFDHSRYSYVVALDGDLQNDPREIPRMIEKLQEGFDLVAGWRKDRKDPFLSRKLPSRIANWVISKFTRVQLHDYGCTLKALRGDVARGIRLYGEMHRFIPALAAEMGARITEIPVNHRPRQYGASKYGISRTIRVILDLLTVKFLLGYSKRPIHLFGTAGLGCGALGMLLLSYMTYQKLVNAVSMGNRPLLLLAVMLVLIGLQFVVFGLLAEVLARTYYESQDKKIYVIRQITSNDSSSVASLCSDSSVKGSSSLKVPRTVNLG